MTSTTESAVEALAKLKVMVSAMPDVNDSDILCSHYVKPSAWLHLTFGDLRALAAQPAPPAASEVMATRSIVDHLHAYAETCRANEKPNRARIVDEVIAQIDAALAATRGGQEPGDVSEAFLKVCEALGIQATASAHLDAAAIKARADGLTPPPDPSARGGQGTGETPMISEMPNPAGGTIRSDQGGACEAASETADLAVEAASRPDLSAREALAKVIWSNSDFDPEDSWDDAYLLADAILASLDVRALSPAPGLPASGEEPDRCIACEKPLTDGDLVYHDASGGEIHASCCGPERESYTGPDGEPLKGGDPIPTPKPYRASGEPAKGGA